jgi:hypothetical protein
MTGIHTLSFHFLKTKKDVKKIYFYAFMYIWHELLGKWVDQWESLQMFYEIIMFTADKLTTWRLTTDDIIIQKTGCQRTTTLDDKGWQREITLTKHLTREWSLKQIVVSNGQTEFCKYYWLCPILIICHCH